MANQIFVAGRRIPLQVLLDSHRHTMARLLWLISSPDVPCSGRSSLLLCAVAARAKLTMMQQATSCAPVRRRQCIDHMISMR